MAKTREPAKQDDDDKKVSFFCEMRRADRQRLKVLCARLGRDMKEVGGELLVSAITEAERKLDKR